MDIGIQILEYWEAHNGQLYVHRLVYHFFSQEQLVKELRTFCYPASDNKPDVDQLPSLFIFCLRLALLTVVGHYLEGRHRGIRSEIMSGGGNTKPGLQSFKMR